MNLLKQQPAAVGAVAAAGYSAVVMILNAFVFHTAVFDPQVIVALASAAGALVIRQAVTPVARPRAAVDGGLVELVPAGRWSDPHDQAAAPGE